MIHSEIQDDTMEEDMIAVGVGKQDPICWDDLDVPGSVSLLLKVGLTLICVWTTHMCTHEK